MALPSSHSDNLRTHLQEGAIYKDKSNNVIRLLSIRGNYCAYVYVSLTNLQSSMHGLVTGLARKDVFADHCMFAADSVKEWIRNQHKDDPFTVPSGIVTNLSSDTKRALLHSAVDFPLACSSPTIIRRENRG
jgi:hypothetical protein